MCPTRSATVPMRPSPRTSCGAAARTAARRSPPGVPAAPGTAGTALTRAPLGGSPDQVAEPRPADVGELTDPRAAFRIVAVVHEDRLAANVVAGDEPPVAAVLRVVAVVAEHHVAILGDDERPPVVVRRARGGRAEARRLRLETVLPFEERIVRPRRIGGRWLVRAVALPLRHPVHVDEPLPHVDRVAGHADRALDERWRRVLGLVDLRRRLEDDDVAAMRVAVEADRRPGDPHADRLPREGDRRAVDELVDEQPVADEEAGHHAPRRDAIRLDD